MRKKIIIIVGLLIYAGIFYLIGLRTSNKGIVLPYNAFDQKFMSLGGNGSGNYICNGNVITNLQANKSSFGKDKSGIIATASDNKDMLDKISLQVSNNGTESILKFSTSVPNANIPEYTITENDNNILSAYYLTKGKSGGVDNTIFGINIFSLNKQNGVAIWSYISPQYNLSLNPGGFMENLLCN